MDEAAEQVQREVERVAHYGYKQEHEDVARYCADGVNTWAITLPASISAIRRE